jgi:TRAP transporter TAXI family solute receptor
MKGKRLTVLLGSVCLVLVLAALAFMPACAKPSPTPPPRTPVNVEFYSPPKGFTIYMLTFAFAEIVNKHSDWVKASTLETLGGADAMYAMAKLPPERRKNSMAFQMETEWTRATQGLPPYTEPLPDLRIMMSGYEYGGVLQAVTLNPEIKSYKDMIGKRVALTPPPGGAYYGFYTVMESWGILDKVKLEYLAFSAMKDSLLTGLIDVGWMGLTIGPFDHYVLSPIVLELAATKPVYFIPHEKADVMEINKKTYYKMVPIVIPKGALGSGMPQQDLPTNAFFNLWFCWKDADPDVIYEICRIWYEFGHELDAAVPAIAGFASNKGRMGYSPYLEEKSMHPGALKFFKEHEIKIGS